jgi:hypothetical protein
MEGRAGTPKGRMGEHPKCSPLLIYSPDRGAFPTRPEAVGASSQDQANWSQNLTYLTESVRTLSLGRGCCGTLPSAV